MSFSSYLLPGTQKMISLASISGTNFVLVFLEAYYFKASLYIAICRIQLLLNFLSHELLL